MSNIAIKIKPGDKNMNHIKLNDYLYKGSDESITREFQNPPQSSKQILERLSSSSSDSSKCDSADPTPVSTADETEQFAVDASSNFKLTDKKRDIQEYKAFSRDMTTNNKRNVITFDPLANNTGNTGCGVRPAGFSSAFSNDDIESVGEGGDLSKDPRNPYNKESDWDYTNDLVRTNWAN